MQPQPVGGVWGLCVRSIATKKEGCLSQNLSETALLLKTVN